MNVKRNHGLPQGEEPAVALLTRYRIQNQPSKTKDMERQQGASAFTIRNTGEVLLPSILLYYPAGGIGLIPYSSISDVLYLPAEDGGEEEVITLYYAGYVVIIMGQNLADLLPLLQQEIIESLCCSDTVIAPDEAHPAVTITSLERYALAELGDIIAPDIGDDATP